MTDTTINPTNPAATAVVQRRPRIKDALASGICKGTDATVKIVDSVAETIGAVATRVKLHNVSTAADILDEYGSQKVKEAQTLIANL